MEEIELSERARALGENSHRHWQHASSPKSQLSLRERGRFRAAEGPRCVPSAWLARR